jgi:hypothetical protein
VGLNDFLYGTPPTTSFLKTGGTQAPLASFAKSMGNYLKGLIGQPAPVYQGKLDPGLSPTLQNIGQMLQGYAMRTPEVIAGASGGLPGGYMAAYKPPPAWDPTNSYNFAFKSPNFPAMRGYFGNPAVPASGGGSGAQAPFMPVGPGTAAGWPGFAGGQQFNFGFNGGAGPTQMGQAVSSGGQPNGGLSSALMAMLGGGGGPGGPGGGPGAPGMSSGGGGANQGFGGIPGGVSGWGAGPTAGGGNYAVGNMPMHSGPMQQGGSNNIASLLQALMGGQQQQQPGAPGGGW